MKRVSAFILAVFLTILSFTDVCRAKADMPYSTYSYNSWGESVYQPQTYLYTGSFTSENFGSKLNYPQDMFITDNFIYIADTGNSRILKLSTDGQLLSEITFAKNEESPLSKPQGIFVDEDGCLYVADTGNSRIVKYDKNGAYESEIGRPVTDLIDDSQIYSPTKVVVDTAGRIYVIAYGINMGLLEFNTEGEFKGFMGATEVSVSMFEYIWKNYFSTAEQKKRMQTIVPTEYSNIFLDSKNFIYATINNLDEEAHMSGADAIRRLNPTGTDVLRRLGNYTITGDLYQSKDGAEWSSFTDVCATEYGCYYILDAAYGKVFVYDYDGNSLFIFGDSGNRDGNVQKPSAIGMSSDCEWVYILDSQLGTILKFEITDYGRHFLGAMEKNNKGDAKGAYEEWQKVLEMNSNCELAYMGIGKTYLKQSRYKEAMDYFKLGNSKKYYSTAFSYYRREVMQKYFPKAMLVAGILIAVVLVLIGVKKFRRWVGEVRCSMENR